MKILTAQNTVFQRFDGPRCGEKAQISETLYSVQREFPFSCFLKNSGWCKPMLQRIGNARHCTHSHFMKKMLLWQQGRESGYRQTHTTASFFSRMLLFLSFWEHFPRARNPVWSSTGHRPYYAPEPNRASTVWGIIVAPK